MKDTRLHHQPPHGSAAPLRADLIAANIFQRVAGSQISKDAARLILDSTMAEEIADDAAVLAFEAAAVFVRESNRRDPYTGESYVPDGLPADDEIMPPSDDEIMAAHLTGNFGGLGL